MSHARMKPARDAAAAPARHGPTLGGAGWTREHDGWTNPGAHYAFLFILWKSAQPIDRRGHSAPHGNAMKPRMTAGGGSVTPKPPINPGPRRDAGGRPWGHGRCRQRISLPGGCEAMPPRWGGDDGDVSLSVKGVNLLTFPFLKLRELTSLLLTVI